MISGPAGAAGWLSEARHIESPNVDARPPGVVVDLLVIHHISLPPGWFTGPAIQQLFCNQLDCDSHPAYEDLRDLRVSAHFLIRRHGGLIQFADIHARAWHAGVSAFRGRDRCNDFSVGVELEGDGERAFTESQYRRLERLLVTLLDHLPIRFLAGHSDIAPDRKTDPGPCFDWSRLHKVSARYGLQGPWLLDRSPKDG